MHKMILAAFASTLAFAALPAAADRDDHGMNHPRCPRGSHWVRAHRDKHGRWIYGHCRHGNRSQGRSAEERKRGGRRMTSNAA